MTTATNAFELIGLSHAYQDDGQETPVLNDINLRVVQGEFVSLIGPSGCGKSTLLKIACGLLPPSEGKLTLNDSPAAPLGTIGYMPQNDLLIPSRTILDNTIVGLEIAGIAKRDARKKAHEHFSAFGLEGFEDRYPDQLSGGMRQRAALLRTFLVERSFYVLDEPFGSLDALTRLSMNRWLTDIWKHSGAGILFTTHELDEALFLSDRIYVMGPRPGRIIAEIPVTATRPRDHAKMARDPKITEQKAQLLELLAPAKAEGGAQ
jgi:ABC-type nitrate/sulfonate/bicarbonate transport system ATPase subunit|tara:strand:+ start:837 stop:1625 length:789 start_codon:yes stop_codon:yes gene_type:complete